MVVKMLSKIPSSEEKYMLQLRMQQDIIQTIFRCGNSTNTGPHRILSPVFHSHHSDRNLGKPWNFLNHDYCTLNILIVGGAIE